jgi:hypothetical protein
MKYLKQEIKWEYIVLAAIIFAAVFLRSYQHKNLLNFQLDQSRDAIIVGDFVRDGFSKIPLLGPHISGSTLQLGPAYYYLLSISAYLFGVSPNSFAIPDCFFSILFVPLLYLFLKLYFSRTTSLALAAIAGVSLFLIIYGRFAWNPNSLPFFTLLAIYGLFKADWRNILHPGWFYLAVLSAVIATQLHYIYFFMAPVLIIAYVIIWKPRFKFKQYLAGSLIILVFYLPEIISEIKTDGANTKLLFKNTAERVPSANDSHNILDKTFYAFQKMEIINWQMITSDEHGSSIKLSKKLLPVCNKQCRKDLPFLVIQTLIFLAGIVASILSYRREKDEDRKKFIFMAWIWMGLMFIISIPIIYRMSPYYYLAAVPPIFIFLGMIFERTKKFFGQRANLAVFLMASVFVFWNVRNDIIYFRQHKALAKDNIENTLGRAIYDDMKVTLEQMEKAVAYIIDHRKSDSPMRVVVDNTFARAVFYLLEYEHHIPACYIKTSSFHLSGKDDLFFIYRRSVNEEMPEEFNDQFIIRSQTKFGNFLVIDAEGKNSGIEEPSNEACFKF